MIPTDTHIPQEHPLMSILLLMSAIFSFILQDITFDSIYIWMFRIMSLVSLGSIILINRKKALAEWKDIFKRQ